MSELPECKKPHLSELLKLRIPFAIIFSASPLGDDAFFVVLASDCEHHNLAAYYSSRNYYGIRERAFSHSDASLFGKLRDTFTRVDLGANGAAYELTKLPFKKYHTKHTSCQRALPVLT